MGFQQVFRLVTRRSKPFHSRTQIWPPNQFSNTGSSIPTKFFLQVVTLGKIKLHS
jgi:hypothetical protein